MSIASSSPSTARVVVDDPCAVLAALPTAVLVIGVDGVVVSANARAGEILGRAPADLVGRGVEHVLAPLAWLTSPARAVEARERQERVVTRPDGTAITVGFNLAAVGDGRHAIVFQDISPWIALRDERDRLMRQAIVGEALPSILHELKNPLAAVSAAVEVLLEEVPPGHVQRELHAILGEVRRMKLGFEGVGAVGRSLRSPRCAAVDHACRDAFRVLALQAEHNGIYTRCDVADLPLVPLDPSVVRAIVFNLVSNAIHACRHGDTIALHARLVSAGMALELAVVDTGEGMRREVLERCTELFFTTKRNGSGIGLALCHRAVTEAHGELRIESVPGFGTAVTVVVPIANRRA